MSRPCLLKSQPSAVSEARNAPALAGMRALLPQPCLIGSEPSQGTESIRSSAIRAHWATVSST